MEGDLKMNILFVTKDYVNPQCGGIDRITYVLATELKHRGHTCMSAYLDSKNPLRAEDSVFIEEVLLKRETHDRQVFDLIESQKIDFIVVQGVDSVMNQELILLRGVINKQQRHVPIFFVFHQMPGFELCPMDVAYLVHQIFGKSWKKYIKQLILQIVLYINISPLQKYLSKKYNIPYRNADKIILLSPSYMDGFNALVGETDLSKYIAIPNMLTFSSTGVMPSNKQRIVLMVSRMDEHAKRIKRAIQIWSRLPKEVIEMGWQLVIVGDGEDLQYYKQYIRANDIKNVQFEGQQNPISYYQKASIFIMTSAFEGWPMTLMEALQNGCVPIAFDSFKAVYDIIDHNNSGIIIPDGDSKTFIDQLARLMKDDERREQMAYAGFVSCQKFSQEKITNLWEKLFNKLLME